MTLTAMSLDALHVLDDSKLTYARHFRKVVAKELRRVEAVLDAEFTKILTQGLELSATSPSSSPCRPKADRSQMPSPSSSPCRRKADRSQMPSALKNVQPEGESLHCRLADHASKLEDEWRLLNEAACKFVDQNTAVHDEENFQVSPIRNSSRSALSLEEALAPTAEEVISNSDIVPTPEAFLSPKAETVISNTAKSDASSSDNTPLSAFVINVRRVVHVHQILSLLHEMIKSTAIAAITLVSVGTRKQMQNTMVFIFFVMTLSSMHESDWDRLEIEDLRTLLPLLIDDEDPSYTGDNPNRLLKVISISTSPLTRYMWHVWHLVLGAAAVIGWLALEYYWNVVSLEQDSGRNNRNNFITEYLVGILVAEEEDATSGGMQLMVLSLMYLLELQFAYIHWRETAAVMPTSSEGVWDPRRHGVPLKYWLFGLPSMWFTCDDTFKKLKLYIDMANPFGRNARTRIFPQEFAYWALSGDAERQELQKALWEAKLFDGCTQRIVAGEDGHSQPLHIDLCFFDNKRQRASFSYPGDFHYFVDPSQAGDDEADMSQRRTGSAISQLSSKKSKRLDQSIRPSWTHPFSGFRQSRLFS